MTDPGGSLVGNVLGHVVDGSMLGICVKRSRRSEITCDLWTKDDHAQE
jgi:hypothetical protein